MNNPISKSALRTVTLAVIAMLAGCASGPNIITNSAPDFSVTNHNTFSFLQPLSTDNGNVRTLLSEELIAATRPELEAAGLQYVETGGDLLVNFGVATRETIQARNTPHTGMSVHHRRGRYRTWAGYGMATSTVEIIQRTEGTIAVDIIDPTELVLVWEGAASGRVTDRVRDNRAEAIDSAIRDIFEQFP